MSSTTCNPCDEFSCACDLFECLSTVLLGRISSLNTAVYVHIKKQNGAEYIQATTSDGTGYVTMDTTLPNSAFFNEYDGLYQIWIMRGGYFCDGDKQAVTCPGGTYTTVGVKFKKTNGVAYSTQHIQLT